MKDLCVQCAKGELFMVSVIPRTQGAITDIYGKTSRH